MNYGNSDRLTVKRKGLNVTISPEKLLMDYLSTLGLILVLLLCSSVADAATGKVNGTVRYEDDIPFVGRVCIGLDAIIDWIIADTAKDGSFEAVVPVGEYDICIDGGRRTGQPITVAEGETATFNLTLKREGGIALTLQTPDQHIVQEAGIQLIGRWTDKNGREKISNQCYHLQDGRFWLQDVPADIKSFHVIVNRGFLGKIVTAEVYTFTVPDPKRTLIMTVPALGMVALRICDDQGIPLPNTKLAYASVKIKAETEFQSSTIIIDEPMTDAEGKLTIGLLGEGKQYGLTVRTVEATGGACPFTVYEKGKADPPDYVLRLGVRDVKQRVFTKDGVPAVNAVIRLSCSWNNRITLREAVTDANGDVVWEALPPAPAMVWGPDIPVGELPADAKLVTIPLPAPVDCPSDAYAFTFTFNTARNDLLGMIDRYAFRGILIPEYKEYPIDILPEMAVPTDNTRITPVRIIGICKVGTPVRMLLWTTKAPIRYAMLTDFYPPRGGGEFVIPAAAPLIAQLQLLSPTGQPIPALNRFQVLPDADNGLTGILDDNQSGADQLPAPKMMGNGIYEVSLPCPGAYRICLDGYRNTMSAPTALRFTITPNPGLIKISMPAPLALVPPGTQISCLPYSSPMTPEIYIAPPGAAQVPIYVDKQTLLAYWYRVTPDTLTFWSAADTQQTARELPLRAITLTVAHADRDMKVPILLLPLLPTPDDKPVVSKRRHSEAHALATPLTLNTPTQLLLWPGEYIICRQDDMQTLISFTVPAEILPNENLTIVLPSLVRDGLFTEMTARYLTITLPEDTHAKGIRGNLRVTDSTGTYCNIVKEFATRANRQVLRLTIPHTVRSLTLQHLGGGVAADIDVSDKTLRDVTIPTWDTGVPFSGTITKADGTPYTKSLMVTIPAGLSAKISTNAQGHFSVPGVLPGILSLTLAEVPMVTWQIDIPATGKTDIQLAVPMKVTSISIERPAMRIQSPARTAQSQKSCIWWLPSDALTAVYINGDTTYNTEFDFATMPHGDGWLWRIIDEIHGQSIAQRFTVHPRDDVMAPHGNYIRYSDVPAGPTLGIILPYKPDVNRPGAISITGQKNRTGASMYVSEPQWTVNPMLKCISTTLQGVPPGEYQVKILTQDAIIEKTVTVTEAGGSLNLLEKEIP